MTAFLAIVLCPSVKGLTFSIVYFPPLPDLFLPPLPLPPVFHPLLPVLHPLLGVLYCVFLVGVE